MALHRVRLDSTSSGGVNQKNDEDDEMASEKQRLDIIEVLSLIPVTREMRLLTFIKKPHVEHASPNTHCAHSLGGQTETHDRFTSECGGKYVTGRAIRN